MKILHLDTEAGWRGGEQQMCYLAQGLAKLGHENCLVCRPGSDCMERAKGMGLTVHPLPVHGDLDLAAGLKLAAKVDEFSADIVHAHTARTHLAAVWAKKFSKRKPKCVAHRRVDFSIHKLPLRLSGLKYKWGVDRYIAITEAVKSVMVADGINAGRISVIHSSVDLKRFEGMARNPSLREEWGVPADAPLIGNVGALVGHKGQEYFIEAAALTRKAFPDAHFIIIGEGPRHEELTTLAKNLNLNARLHFAGFRKDVPQCLAEFFLFCMSSWGEGLGSSVLEAMAMRLPVVTTAAGGLVEAVEDGVTGLVVPPRNAEALAEALCRLLNDPNRATVMGRSGRERVEREFTTERMVERTLALYQSLLEEET